MTAAAKYLFDTDFGAGTKPMIPFAEHATKLTQAEAAGYRNGCAAAEAKLQAEAKREAAAMLVRIAASIEALRNDGAALEARLEADAIGIAVAVARKLAPALIAREPFAEIAALVGDCFRHLNGAPHVVVRVNDALYDEAQRKLIALARERGCDGRLVVLAEPDVAPGDCRVEWADGGVTRDRAAVEAAIDELIARYLGARHGSAATPTPAMPTQQGGSQQ